MKETLHWSMKSENPGGGGGWLKAWLDPWLMDINRVLSHLFYWLYFVVAFVFRKSSKCSQKHVLFLELMVSKVKAEAEAGGRLWFWGQSAVHSEPHPGLSSETLFQSPKPSKSKENFFLPIFIVLHYARWLWPNLGLKDLVKWSMLGGPLWKLCLNCPNVCVWSGDREIKRKRGGFGDSLPN